MIYYSTIDPWKVCYPPPRLLHVEPYFRALVLDRVLWPRHGYWVKELPDGRLAFLGEAAR